MKLRALSFAVLLVFSITAVAADTDRKHIVLQRAPQASALPFSEGVLVGNTLYIAGHIGIDPKTGKPGASAEDEAKLVMDGIKQTVEAGGLSMDDLVSVQVFCSDVANYDAFNAVYRTYFHGEYPARAFLGSGKLLFGARYEVMGIAVKPQK
ncbi:MAG: RidA family protein [Acidobacteriia bacterium]|nr:RidA family protein [Terriglobia bacterium]